MTLNSLVRNAEDMLEEMDIVRRKMFYVLLDIGRQRSTGIKIEDDSPKAMNHMELVNRYNELENNYVKCLQDIWSELGLV